VAGTIGKIDTGQTAIATRRALLETQVAAAITRAQRQYIQSQAPVQAPMVKGPAHLGTKVDIQV